MNGEQPPIDLEHLAQYTAGDPAIEAEVLALFLSNAAQQLTLMADAGGGTGWAEAAHTLKGAARGVGASEIATLAEAAESAGEADCGQFLARLEQALMRVKAFVTTLPAA